MQAVRNTNVIKPGMYRICRVVPTKLRAPQLNQTFRILLISAYTSTGVAHKTNVSRPQTRSNQMKDKVVPYTSHAKLKKTEIGKSSYSLLDSGMHQAYEGKSSPTQAWLWHRRLSHLNFDTINLLLKKDIVNGLPKLKYVKDQLCSSCEVSKAKRSSFKSKTVPSSKDLMGNQRDVRALLLMDTSGLVPQRQKASDYDNPDPTPELQNVYPSADTTVPSQQELDLLFGPLYDGNFSMMVFSCQQVFFSTDNSVPQETPLNEYSNLIRTINSYKCSC
ncbi:retrovirus-related pol polyprotein from transposon TNT 1-94 [Tanacetum coccineum]